MEKELREGEGHKKQKGMEIDIVILCLPAPKSV